MERTPQWCPLPSITPTLIRTTADGDIVAVFPGGVEINADEFAFGGRPSHDGTVQSPVENVIVWKRESNGAVVATIQAYKQTGFASQSINAADFTVENDETVNDNFVKLGLALNRSIPGRSSVYGSAQDDGGNRYDATLIDSDGKSTFPKLYAQGDTRIILGETTAAGGISNDPLNQGGGATFSVNRTAVGAYTVTYGNAFASPAVVVVCAVGAGAITAKVGTSGAATFTVGTFTTTTGANVDAAFAFWAMGLV